jgi:formylglycine-generating enzyme required for sulfatase activity
MQINKWKIFGYTVVTWFLFSVLARIIFEMAYQFGGYISIVSCQGAVWGWMSLFMGIYLATKFKKWIELVWGVVLFFICTLPVIGMFIGIGYFARAYVKLEKARWEEEPEYRRREEEERKEREVTEQGDEEKEAQEEAHVAWKISQNQKILAVVLALGVVLVGYLAFAPGSTTNSIGMEFVRIPAGEFDMGSSSGEIGRDDEGPVHHVKIEKSFYMGRYEVTQKEWREVMGYNPSSFKGDDLPVEKVSGYNVQKFIEKLNEKEGTDKYRLPSEAEWEYACRAGTTTRYSFGDSESKLGDYAWYCDNSGSKTHSVGKKRANPWGLYDMHGNVYERVQDKWHYNYTGAPTDGSAWESSGSRRDARVSRGGGWNRPGGSCLSANRNEVLLGTSRYYIGFRLLKEM